MKQISKIKDLTGQKFGRLTVIGLSDTNSRKTYWICQCDCGNIKTIRSDSLQCGAIKSCGCLKKEQDNINLTTHHRHFMSNTRIYHEWQGMKARCTNKNNKRYERYGGRGITVCEEWENSFESFYEWAISNGYTDNLTIDRIDNDGNYEPNNCRWSTIKEQSLNRSSNVNIRIGNTVKTLSEWCEIFNLSYPKISARYHRNQDITLDELFKG